MGLGPSWGGSLGPLGELLAATPKEVSTKSILEASGGHLEAALDDSRGNLGAIFPLKTPQLPQWWPQEDPKRPREAARWPQDGPKRPQDGPKMAPRLPQEASKAASRWPPDASKIDFVLTSSGVTAKNSPRGPKDPPKRPPDPPRTPPGGPPEAYGNPPEASKTPPGSFPGPVQELRNTGRRSIAVGVFNPPPRDVVTEQSVVNCFQN